MRVNIKQKRLMDMRRFVRERRVVSLSEICREFDVSLNTVRRDVNELVEAGSIVKVHGGIMACGEEGDEAERTEIVHYPYRHAHNLAQKERIGALAAEMVEDGDIVFIDSGSTTACMVTQELLQRDILVVSNSLPVFERLQGAKGKLRLYALGGAYFPDVRAFSGSKAIQELQNINITKAFLGASAVSIASGVSNNLSYELELKQAAAKQAEKIILLADGEKLGRRAAMRICAVEELYALITDRPPAPPLMSGLAAQGVRVIYPDSSKDASAGLP